MILDFIVLFATVILMKHPILLSVIILLSACASSSINADLSVWMNGERLPYTSIDVESTLRDHFASIYKVDLFTQGHTWVMFINGSEEEFTLDYAIKDKDKIFLTTSAGSAQVLYELEQSN